MTLLNFLVRRDLEMVTEEMQQQEIAVSLRRDKYRNDVAEAFHSPFTFLFDNSSLFLITVYSASA